MMYFWIAVAMLAGLGMFGITLHIAWRWRQLERLVVRKIRHHERFAKMWGNRYANQWHRAQVQALNEVLLAMETLERGKRTNAYALQFAEEVKAQWGS